MNILTDKLPEEYKGYRINTDFRVGIQLSRILDNKVEDDDSWLDDVIDLLWGNGVPTTLSEDGLIVVDYDLVQETILWFRCGGNPTFELRKAKRKQVKQSELTETAYDFEEDSGYILAAFMQQYGIDLADTKMHWFKFLALFKSLQDCAFTKLQEIRTLDTKDMHGKQLADALKAKKEAAVTNVTKARERELRLIFGDEWEEHI